MGGIHDPRWDKIDGPMGVDTSLISATSVCLAGTWDEAKKAGEISLVFDERHRRRIRMETDEGRAFLLDLPKAVALNHGDGLCLTTGDVIAVVAAPEPLMEVRAEDETHLVRLGWHIGNRHLPAMIKPSVIYIRPDHVIEDMLIRLGAQVRHVTMPFQPEGGAYSAEASTSTSTSTSMGHHHSGAHHDH